MQSARVEQWVPVASSAEGNLTEAGRDARGFLQPRGGWQTHGGRRGDANKLMARLAGEGVDTVGLAARVMTEAAKSFVEAWNDLMSRIGLHNTSIS